jgi:GT2 family glycosyltransferase
MYVEDLEWCWRAQQQGWAVRFEPSALVRHVGNASGQRAYGRRRTQTWLRNTYRFYADVHGRPAALAFRALNVAAAARLYAMSRWRHDRPAQDRWADHFRASVAP